jgi:hypothetical protein
MNNKKMMSNTMGVVVGGIGISEANKIGGMGGMIGTSMGVGMVSEVMPKDKKKGGWF